MKVEFIVVKVPTEKAADVSRTLDEQFCKPGNPLAGSFSMVRKAGGWGFVIIPVNAPGFAVKMAMTGLKKSLKPVDKRLEVLSVKKSPFDKVELQREYDEEVARRLA